MQVLADNTDAPFQHLRLAEEEGEGSADARPEHPYHDSIATLAERDAEHRWEAPPPRIPALVDDSPWEWVDRPEQLAAVAAEAGRAGSVALDVEHHARRSYLGVTCLLQLSTGEPHAPLSGGSSSVCCLCEYDVPYPTPRRQGLPDRRAGPARPHAPAARPARRRRRRQGAVARRGLAHESMGEKSQPPAARTQVLHGADNDVLWCQRDFHLYLVNVFDTEKACQVRREGPCTACASPG